jgi:hypothetical protein
MKDLRGAQGSQESGAVFDRRLSYRDVPSDAENPQPMARLRTGNFFLPPV